MARKARIVRATAGEIKAMRERGETRSDWAAAMFGRSRGGPIGLETGFYFVRLLPAAADCDPSSRAAVWRRGDPVVRAATNPIGRFVAAQ